MPHRNPARDAFNPEHIETIERAYECALDFVLRSRYGDDDPNVKENLAVHIIEAAKEPPEMSMVAIANRAIARYRAHRDTMRAIELKRAGQYGTQASLRSACTMSRRTGVDRLEQDFAAGILQRRKTSEASVRV